MAKNNFFNRRMLNLDSTYRCPLLCPNCQRQTYFTSKGLKVPVQEITFKNFKKITNFFNNICFEGQYSDPVHHPNFIKMIEECYHKKVNVHVQHATGAKSKSWYRKAWQANPDAHWRFGIDGLPKDSHKYRINQDGIKLFDIMKESLKYLKQKPEWQYIVFRYNEDDIDEAIRLANTIGVNFYLIKSSRWLNANDPNMPKNPHNRILTPELKRFIHD